MELHIVISVCKYGNHYFKWTLFFSLNRLNPVVHSCHFFNCINYLIHTTIHTVQLVWEKLIIAVCFKSVLHPQADNIITLSHWNERAGPVLQGSPNRCRVKVQTVFEVYPPCLWWDLVYTETCICFMHLLGSSSFWQIIEWKWKVRWKICLMQKLSWISERPRSACRITSFFFNIFHLLI